jgi:hypothetical protein
LFQGKRVDASTFLGPLAGNHTRDAIKSWRNVVADSTGRRLAQTQASYADASFVAVRYGPRLPFLGDDSQDQT